MSDFALTVDPLKCLRNDYAHNSCDICLVICPEKATLLKRGKIAIEESLCTLCYACVGACPTEAIESYEFDPNIFIAKELSIENNELKQKLISDSLKLSCKEIGVCLSVFDDSLLISLGLKSRRLISLDVSPCNDCDLNKESKLKNAIDSYAQKANEFLSEFANKKIEILIQKKSDRRDFFKTVFKRSATVAEELSESVEKPKTKLPLRRIILKNAIKEFLDDKNRFITKDYSFSVSKTIDKSCTNCKTCVEFCPTNALFYSSDFSKIYFQSGKCVDCDICNDICVPKSFVDGYERDMATFVFDKATIAIEHNLIVCRSCKLAFASKEGEEICPNCREYGTNFAHMFLTAEELERIQ